MKKTKKTKKEETRQANKRKRTDTKTQIRNMETKRTEIEKTET